MKIKSVFIASCVLGILVIAVFLFNLATNNKTTVNKKVETTTVKTKKDTGKIKGNDYKGIGSKNFQKVLTLLNRNGYEVADSINYDIKQEAVLGEYGPDKVYSAIKNEDTVTSMLIYDFSDTTKQREAFNHARENGFLEIKSENTKNANMMILKDYNTKMTSSFFVYENLLIYVSSRIETVNEDFKLLEDKKIWSYGKIYERDNKFNQDKKQYDIEMADIQEAVKELGFTNVSKNDKGDCIEFNSDALGRRTNIFVYNNSDEARKYYNETKDKWITQGVTKKERATRNNCFYVVNDADAEHTDIYVILAYNNQNTVIYTEAPIKDKKEIEKSFEDYWFNIGKKQ